MDVTDIITGKMDDEDKQHFIPFQPWVSTLEPTLWADRVPTLQWMFPLKSTCDICVNCCELNRQKSENTINTVILKLNFLYVDLWTFNFVYIPHQTRLFGIKTRIWLYLYSHANCWFSSHVFDSMTAWLQYLKCWFDQNSISPFSANVVDQTGHGLLLKFSTGAVRLISITSDGSYYGTILAPDKLPAIIMHLSQSSLRC